MRYLLTLISLVASLTIIRAQHTDYTIAQKVLKHVNELRDSLDLPTLKLDNILNEAGDDHAYYIAQKGALTHFQKTFLKETPGERIHYYGGNRTYTGENIAFVSPKWKSEKVLDTDSVAKALYLAWFHSPPHYKNMVNPEYTRMGLGISINAGKVFSAQVFSSSEITLPRAFKKADFAWGVRPGEITCKDDTQVYETMFFANSVELKGNEVFFYFHDLEFFRNVIQNDNDGIAIDIVLREQLPCGKENQFHISQVYDGEMQQPVYKNDLYRHNLSSNPRKIRVKIGEIPPYLQNEHYEINVIIINDNILCDYAIPTYVPSDIYPLLKVDPYYETGLAENNAPRSLHLSDSLHLALNYDRSKEFVSGYSHDDYSKFLSWAALAKNIKIDCFASVEGRSWFNERLLEQRKKNVFDLMQFVGVDTLDITYSGSENWPLMENQINTLSLNEFTNKNQNQIKYYLKTHPSKLYDSLLYEQRKTHIYATVDTSIKIESFNHYRIAQYYDSTIRIHELPWNKLLVDDYIKPEMYLQREIFDSLYQNPLYKTNLLGASPIKYANAHYDSTAVEQFIAEVDRKNHKQVFNYAFFLTSYWFKHYSRSQEEKGVARTIPPQKLKEMVDEIDTSIIRSRDLGRMKLNILLSGIHYYVAKDNWSLVNHYFDLIVNEVKTDFFSAKEAVELALFCNHFHKFKQAVAILDPFFDKELLDENGLFILAQTGHIQRQELKVERYHEYMEAAKRVNQKRYCSWLNANFQIQRDEYLKKDYCTSCR